MKYELQFKISDAYKSRGKRLIAQEEISLAAIYVSVTKHCNPNANMTEHIFAAPFPATQTQPYNRARQILVPETQSPVNPPTPSMRSVVEESMNISADAESLMSNDSPSSSTKSIKMDTRIFEHSRTGPVKRGKTSPAAEEKEDDDVPSAKRRCESLPLQSDYVRQTPHRKDLLDGESNDIRFVREVDCSHWSGSKSAGSNSNLLNSGGQPESFKRDLDFGNNSSDTSVGETKLFSKESTSLSPDLNRKAPEGHNPKGPEPDDLQSNDQRTNSAAPSVSQSESGSRPSIRCIISEYVPPPNLDSKGT